MCGSLAQLSKPVFANTDNLISRTVRDGKDVRSSASKPQRSYLRGN